MTGICIRVKTHTFRQELNEVSEGGISDPIGRREGKERGVGLKVSDGKEGPDGGNRTESATLDVRNGDFKGAVQELVCLHFSDLKDDTPLSKMHIATKKEGPGFPSFLKFWNQVSRSEK